MKKPNEPSIDDDVHERSRQKERVRRYLRDVADLNGLIVDELRSVPDGLTFEAITERFRSYPPAQVRDALDSAIEDEYIEKFSRKGEDWYRTTPFEEP